MSSGLQENASSGRGNEMINCMECRSVLMLGSMPAGIFGPAHRDHPVVRREFLVAYP